MSLFQCERCGCVENTALAAQGFKMRIMQECFSWKGIEDRQNKMLCSACGPTHFRDGKISKFGVWHGVFSRTYLPKGMFFTNSAGNLEHKETGSELYKQYALPEPPQ